MGPETISETYGPQIYDMYQDFFIIGGGFFPVLAKHNDNIYCFCRTNAGHLGRFGEITIMISTNGLDWYEKGIIKKENSDIRNPSVFILPNGEILVSAYKYNVYNEAGFSSPKKLSSPENLEPLLFFSKDNGETWKQKQHAFDNIYTEIDQFSPHGQMLFYKEKLLMPVYNKLGAFLLSSTNEGENWEIFSHIAKNTHEPSVVVTPNNNLTAVLRTAPGDQRGRLSLISHYINNEWTTPTAITEPMQFPASLLTLSNNQILLTYSDRNIEHQRILAKLSSDNGQTWGPSVQISETFQNCDFGYPSTIEIAEGNLLTTFYANLIQNPRFHFKNLDFYNSAEAIGYYCSYSLKELQKSMTKINSRAANLAPVYTEIHQKIN